MPEFTKGDAQIDCPSQFIGSVAFTPQILRLYWSPLLSVAFAVKFTLSGDCVGKILLEPLSLGPEIYTGAAFGALMFIIISWEPLIVE